MRITIASRKWQWHSRQSIRHSNWNKHRHTNTLKWRLSEMWNERNGNELIPIVHANCCTNTCCLITLMLSHFGICMHSIAWALVHFLSAYIIIYRSYVWILYIVNKLRRRRREKHEEVSTMFRKSFWMENWT